MLKPTKLNRGVHQRKSWLAAAMLSALVAASPDRHRRRRRHVAHHAGRQCNAGGPAADVARRILQADVHQLPGRRLGTHPHGGRDRRESERGCQHAGARRGLRLRADGPRRRAITASPRSCPTPGSSISGNSAALGGVQIQNSVSGIGDLTVVPVMLGLEVRQLAVRLPDAGLCAHGQLRGRPARQHGPQLLDLRSDRRRGVQQRQVGLQRGRAPRATR